MQVFTPVFKDDKDKVLTVAMLLSSMFFLFVPSLIVIFIPKDYISENTYNIAKAIFNYELFLFIVSLFFLVPIIGWLIGFVVAPILEIWNIIVLILALCAIAGNKEIKIPVIFNFI
jgi:hypothetical protein